VDSGEACFGGGNHISTAGQTELLKRSQMGATCRATEHKKVSAWKALGKGESARCRKKLGKENCSYGEKGGSEWRVTVVLAGGRARKFLEKRRGDQKVAG